VHALYVYAHACIHTYTYAYIREKHHTEVVLDPCGLQGFHTTVHVNDTQVVLQGIGSFTSVNMYVYVCVRLCNNSHLCVCAQMCVFVQ
jgi:hypothetical protein